MVLQKIVIFLADNNQFIIQYFWGRGKREGWRKTKRPGKYRDVIYILVVKKD